MKLYQPVSPWIVNQKFGENRACVPTGGGAVITCDGTKPPTGYKSLYGKKGHLGIDLFSVHGQPVYCAADGVVHSIDTSERTGLDVKVLTTDGKDKYIHVYEHLLGYQPKVGDEVKRGRLIGWADNTGYSSGDHLHFELKKYIDDGYVSVDPMKYMEPKFAKDADGVISLYESLILLLEQLVDKLRGGKEVSYEEALKNLRSGPLTGKRLRDAEGVLKKHYGR